MSVQRLSETTLVAIEGRVKRPGYDRAALSDGIVHLGLGAFHRAHQAIYTEAVLETGDLRWGTVGVSLRNVETRDAMEPQDGLYTAAVRDGSGDRFQVVGNIRRLLVAPEDPEAVIRALAGPEVRIVSLTVTEKGYCHRPATGDLDEDHAGVRLDLANPSTPKTVPGYLVEAIARRRAAGLAPLTLLSCDNLAGNGTTLAKVVQRFAQLRDPELGAYVAGEVACPSTMVDRIVPATTAEDRALVAAALGVADAWPVMTEPFSQWVIEDRFSNGRPEWDAAGATFVADVAAFETMKLRLLNGSHSTLAYLGLLAGHETVAEAMTAPGFSSLVEGVMAEASSTLGRLPGFDLASYRGALVARFRNPALRHKTAQIAMDGSQKVPQRLLGTIRDRLAAGAPFDRLALGLAGWMVYATGRDERGGRIDVRDPLAVRIAATVAGERTPDGLLDAYLGLSEVFGTDLPASEIFRNALRAKITGLLMDGAARMVAHYATD